MTHPICPSCGHRNEDDANFCSSCGTELARDVGDATGQISIEELGDADDTGAELAGGVAVDVPYLAVRRGPKGGSRYALDLDVVTAGRHPDSDIFLDDVTVSRRHAELERRGAGYVVRDVGSLNGTYVNRRLVDGEVALHDGDELQIGRFKLIYLDHRP